MKARICETLNTNTYPEKLKDFKTHDLETLLFLTGRAGHIKQSAFAEWTFILQNWQPEMRYKAAGTVLPSDVQTLIDATKTLLNLL